MNVEPGTCCGARRYLRTGVRTSMSVIASQPSTLHLRGLPAVDGFVASASAQGFDKQPIRLDYSLGGREAAHCDGGAAPLRIRSTSGSTSSSEMT